MVNADAYISELTEKLLAHFSNRLLFVGLQGSYLRGDMTENSDMDVMVVIRDLTVDDLETYRHILREMVYDVKSCGFICGERDLENWNPLEIFGLLHGTKPYFGELGCLVPKYTVDDIRNFAKLSLNNLYHEICHRYIHAGPEKSEARLSNCYKSVFFILQIVHYLRMGEFVPTKPMLLDRLTGMDAEILRYAMNGENFAWRDQFTLLFAWCQKTMSEI